MDMRGGWDDVRVTQMRLSASVSSSRTVCLWMFRGGGLWNLSSGSSNGQCTCPSCLCPSLVGCELLKNIDAGVCNKNCEHKWTLNISMLM